MLHCKKEYKPAYCTRILRQDVRDPKIRRAEALGSRYEARLRGLGRFVR